MSGGPGQRFTRCEGTDWLTDYIAKAMCSGRMGTREAEKWFPGQVRGNAPEPPPDGFLVPQGLTEIFKGWWGDLGAAARNRPKPPPPTRRQRLKSKIEMWRNLAARRAYRIVAGYWPDNGEDDW